MRLAAAALLAGACCAPAPPAPLSAPIAAAGRVWKIQSPDGTFGSGFPVRCTPKADGTFLVELLTARHAVQDRVGTTYLSLTAARPGGPLLTFLGVRTHPDWDVAAVSFSSPEWVLPHEIDARPLRVGDRVWHSGYQLGDLTLTEGFVNGWNRVSSASAPGGSGGPVFDRHGRAVALVIELRGTSIGIVFHAVIVVPLAAVSDWI